MVKILRFSVARLLGCVGALAVSIHPSFAQLTPDNSLGKERSLIIPSDQNNDRIGGGATRGVNLFHSFQDFNVGVGRGVYFANPQGITNIFSRVTGGNSSNIFGKLGVLGDANLFLLNPNGIVFGKNASLDIRGSFMGTTANSLVFPNGVEFSATNPEAPPLLAINVPIGLQFGSQPGNITSQAVIRNSQGDAVGGLGVGTGSTLAPQIIPTDQNNDRIGGGAARGTKLFHSFQDFNVDVNLFLLNPNGILFGKNAQLDIRGSFMGTTTLNVIDTNALIANSCISRSGKHDNTFLITGSGALRNSPGDASISIYSTGEVRNIEPTSVTWKKGEPIIEPTAVYRLSGGRLVLSRECQ